MSQLPLWPDPRIDRLSREFGARYRFGKFDWHLEIPGFDVEHATYATIQPASLADEWLWRYTCASMLCAHETLAHTTAAMKELVARWPHWTDLAAAPVPDVRRVLREAGVARDEQKGPWLVHNAQTVAAWGAPPKAHADLVRLRGVGDHVADIVRAYVFGDNVLAIDTHVKRVAGRLGIPVSSLRERTDLDLAALSSAFVEFGKTVCSHVAPKCPVCPVRDLCT